MIKLNNKGFAVTTIIYGLSILGVLVMSVLMGVLSAQRVNNKNMSKAIEEDLNRFSRVETSFAAQASEDYPKAQKYVVPEGETGWYRIELWGARGGAAGGRGAYTSGIIYLRGGQELYFYVGKKSNSTGVTGQSTDVRLVSGPYTGSESTAVVSANSRIMVAAGGGANTNASGGTLYGYTDKMTPSEGIINSQVITGSDNDFDLAPVTPELTTNGTLSGYPKDYTTNDSLKPGELSNKLHPQNSKNGGDGYIGSESADVGGISFISGYAGTHAIIRGVLESTPTYIDYDSSLGEDGSPIYESTGGKKYYFVDGKMFAGVNDGNGRAKISKLISETSTMTTLPFKNDQMKGVLKIRDCLDIENNPTDADWNRALIMANGVQKDLGSGTAVDVAANDENGNNTYKCRVYDVDASGKDLDEIAIWHRSGVDYINHTIEVSKTGTTWTYLKKWGKRAGTANGVGSKLSETEGVTGTRISAYQPDYTKYLGLSGNYYIIPILAENKAITAAQKAEDDNNLLSIEYLNGYKRQTWSIESLNNNTQVSPNLPGGSKRNEYKIVELARFKALSIYKDENKLYNGIRASSEFNKHARNEIEIWKILPNGNGTYRIQTVQEIFDVAHETGNICPQTVSGADHYNKVIIGRNNETTQRFKFVQIDY